MYLLFEVSNHPITHPETRSIAQAVGGIQRSAAIALLLELGAIRAQFLRTTAQLLREQGNDPNISPLSYSLTPFGEALHEYVISELGLSDPEVQAYLDAEFHEEPPQGTT